MLCNRVLDNNKFVYLLSKLLVINIVPVKFAYDKSTLVKLCPTSSC
jgi:hypothetical protein